MALHPQAQAFLDALAEQNSPGWEELSPKDGREVFSCLRDLFGEGPEIASVEDRVIGEDLSIRIYSPTGEGPFPAIVFFHGGGWVLGDLDTHDTLCRHLANSVDAVVVSVDYRRSPETVFPGGLNDCYFATRYVAKEADRLRVDPEKIIVAGDSAGGNFAAAVAILARDTEGPSICMQVLIYPVLNHKCDSPSYTQFADGYGLTKKSMEWFWQQYLGACSESDSRFASPLLTEQLHGLPPAHVITADYDVLRDEGESYAKRLLGAGVPTTHRRYEGMIHGFVHFSGLFDTGRDAVDDIATMIRDTIARSTSAPAAIRA